MQMLYLTAKGLTPILMNNPAETMGQEEEAAVKGKRKLDNPEEQAIKRRYLLPDGNFYVPAVAVRNCILKAASGWTVKRKSIRPILAGSLQLLDPAFPLLGEDGKPIPGNRYTVSKMRVVIKATKAAIIRGRPEIFPWQLECAFLFDSKRVDLDILYRTDPDTNEPTGVLVDAGAIVGLLDYRPEKMGWFGRFEVQDIRVE